MYWHPYYGNCKCLIRKYVQCKVSFNTPMKNFYISSRWYKCILQDITEERLGYFSKNPKILTLFGKQMPVNYVCKSLCSRFHVRVISIKENISTLWFVQGWTAWIDINYLWYQQLFWNDTKISVNTNKSPVVSRSPTCLFAGCLYLPYPETVYKIIHNNDKLKE